jgi:hypothetical protein
MIGSWASRRDTARPNAACTTSLDERVVAQLGHDDLGRGQSPGAERTRQLGRGIGGTGTGGVEPGGDEVQQRRRRTLGRFHLHLAEACSDAGALQHRHLVVVELGEQAASAVPHGERTAHGLQVPHRREAAAVRT